MAPRVPTVSLPSPSDLLGAVRREAQRNTLRARNGLRLARGSHQPKSGLTPHDVVWRSGRARLLRYRSDSVRWRPPIMFVYSLAGRAYILDLTPGNSMVERLRNEGFDVFLLDFGVPDERDAGNTLATYAVDYLGDALAAAVLESKDTEVNVVGYCFGGLITLLGLAADPTLPVRSLATIATPVNTRELGALASIGRESNLDVDDIVDETGNVPGNIIELAFRANQPTGAITQYADLLENMWSDDYLTAYQLMMGWAHDQVPMAGATARDVVDQLLRSDSLPSQGTCLLGGRQVNLSNVRVPFRSIVAENDDIVPPAASAGLADLVGSADASEQRVPGGHIGLMVGRTAHKRSIPILIEFFKSSSEPAASVS